MSKDAPHKSPKKFWTAYDPSFQVGVDCGEGKTQQSFMDECDIHKIISRAEKTGTLRELLSQSGQPLYGDFSEVPEYQESMNIIVRAREQFDALPSELRDRFANSPERFLEFTSNPKNVEEMVSLGLAIARKEPDENPRQAPKKQRSGSTDPAVPAAGGGPDA